MTIYVPIKKRGQPAGTTRCLCGVLCQDGQSFIDHQFFCQVAAVSRGKRKQLIGD